MVPHKGREGPRRDPASAQLFRGGIDEAADVCACIAGKQRFQRELLVCHCREQGLQARKTGNLKTSSGILCVPAGCAALPGGWRARTVQEASNSGMA